MDNCIQAFVVLVRVGLWEKEARLVPFGKVGFEEVYRLASQQSVVGLVAVGLEHVGAATVYSLVSSCKDRGCGRARSVFLPDIFEKLTN